VNGARTVWPLDKDKLKVLGVRLTNAYVSGGTITEVDRLPVISFDASDNIFLGGTPTAASLQISPSASYVNWVKIQGGTTGNPGVVGVDGETNVGLILQSKGTGSIRMLPGGTEALRLNRVASSVNYWDLTPAATGNVPVLKAAGTDADIVAQIESKGASEIRLMPGGTEGVRIGRIASATSYIFLEGSAGSLVTTEARGTVSDIDYRIVPKGTGLVRFGTWTSNADAAVNGYIQIKDAAGNTRKLATIA
jgi:hypothetical protein